MNIAAIAQSALWAGLFSCGLGILFTSPPRQMARTFLCGLAARLTRDLLMGAGMSINWATVIAAAVLVLVAVAILREQIASPVVLFSGVIPLGAAVAMFRMIMGLVKVSTLQGDALSAASITLSADMGKVFTTTLAIAVGLGAGMAVVRLLRRESVWVGD